MHAHTRGEVGELREKAEAARRRLGQQCERAEEELRERRQGLEELLHCANQHAGRLAEQLVLQFTDPEWMAFAEQLVASIVDVGVFAAEHAGALQACGAPGVLMHAQVFGTLTGLTGWLERHVAAARDGDAAAEVRLDAVVDRLLTVASPALGEEMPPVVSSAAGTISQPYISDLDGHAVHS